MKSCWVKITQSKKEEGIQVGMRVRLKPNFGFVPEDLPYRNQLAEVTDDLFSHYQLPQYRGIYEVRLISGSKVGETRLVTINEVD